MIVQNIQMKKFQSLDAWNAATDLDDLDQFIQSKIGYSVDEIIEQYGKEEE